jgi:hypothetical protein
MRQAVNLGVNLPELMEQALTAVSYLARVLKR